MIYTTANNRLISANFALISGVVDFLTIKVDCLTGYSLSVISSLTVEAKNAADPLAVYTNLGTTPVDLGAWNGTRQTFLIRLTSASSAVSGRQALSFKVGR